MRAVIIEPDVERRRILCKPLEAASTTCIGVASWSEANPHLVSQPRPALVVCNFEALIHDGLNSLLASDAQLKVLGLPSVLVYDDAQARDVDAVRMLVSFAETLALPAADASLTRLYNSVVPSIARITPDAEIGHVSGIFGDGDPFSNLIQDAQLSTGTMIDGRFEIEDFVEAGGMGQIYRARQQPLGRPVALKVMRSDLAAESDAAARFELEARTVSRLTHPHTIVLFDYGVDPEPRPGRPTGLMYLAMEWLDGQTLEHVLDTERRVEPRRTARIGVQIAQSLSEAHQKSIVHRDLKPGNIFLLRSDFVKVLDFGIAKLVDTPEANAITRVGTICGTPEYMSPEQARGTDLDGRSDLYALGCVLYAMLTGEPPFVHDQAIQVIIHHQTKPPPALPSNVPPALIAVVDRCLEKKIEDRLNSADDVAELLQMVVDGRDDEVLARLGHAAAPPEPAADGLGLGGGEDDEFLLVDPFAEEPAPNKAAVRTTAHAATAAVELGGPTQESGRIVVEWPPFDHGSLAEMTSARWLHLAHQGKLTGKMTITKGRVSHSGWMRDGELVKVAGTRDVLPGTIAWTEGEFAFETTDMVPEGEPLSFLPWLYGAIRLHTSVNQVASLFAKDNDKFPTRTTVYERDQTVFESLEHVAEIAELCNGDRMLGRLMVDAGLNFEHVCQALVLLIETHAVVLRRAPSRTPLRVIFGGETSSGRVARPKTLRSALSGADQMLVDKLKGMLEQFNAGRYHEAFGVKKGSGTDAVQMAFTRFTRDYSKGRLGQKPTPIPTLGNQVHALAHDAFEELLLVEAEATSHLSAEESVVLQSLRDAKARFGGPDFHRGFGLERGCGSRKVDDTYFGLVNQFHPDQYAAYRHPEIKTTANDVFIALQRAYQKLLSLEPDASPSASRTMERPVTSGVATAVSPSGSQKQVTIRPPPASTPAPSAGVIKTRPTSIRAAARPATPASQPVSPMRPQSQPARPAVVAPSPPKSDPAGGRYKVKVPIAAPRTRRSGSTPVVSSPPRPASRQGSVSTPRVAAPSPPTRSATNPSGASHTGSRTTLPPAPANAGQTDAGGKKARKMSEILAERAAARRAATPDPSSETPAVDAPGASQMADLRSAEEHFRQGSRYLQQQRIEEANRAFELATQADAESGSYAAHLAWTRFLCDELSEDATHVALRESRKKRDGGIHAAFFLGKLSVHRGDLPAAKTAFEQVLQRNPRNVDAQRELRLVKQRIESESENEAGLLGRLRRKLRGDS